MGVRFQGHVLRGARIAPSNSITTGEPNTGVVRFPITLPAAYTLDAPEFVDPAADQYRASILQGPGTTPTEYLVWAQNSSQLALLDDGDSWWTEDGVGTIPQGTIPVTNNDPPEVAEGATVPTTYGTDRIVVTDNGGRNISNIIVIVVARGDVDYDDDGWKDDDEESVLPSDWAGQPRDGDTPYITLEIDSLQQVPDAGLVYLTEAQKTELGGGVSLERGDQIISVRYTAAPARFWWTRNDRYETRFGWNGKKQRWQPYKGTGAINVGTLQFGVTYKMDPPIRNMPVGSYLPGDSTTPDSYSTLRVGSDAGATGVPVGNVRVKNNSELEEFDFSTEPVLNAVMGQSNGELKFNPSFVQQHAGKTIWFNYSGFQEKADGVVGALYQADLNPLYVAPVPGPTDFPFIRLGSRRPLQPTLVATEAALENADAPASGSVLVALSTGRLRLALDDVRKADPDREDDFDKNYLGENVYYDGVALNAVPQSVRPAVQLLDGDGDEGVANSDVLYVPDAEYLPSEFAADDQWRGLGVSGILDVPDGTGSLPVLPGVAASVRPGGDTLAAASTGRIRQVSDGIGDTIIFTRKGAIETLVEESTDADLPSMGFQVKSSKAYIALERGAHGSRVFIGKKDRKRFGDSPIYFLQASLTPAVRTTSAEIYSRNRTIFRFDGTETLYFAVDGVSHVWTPTTLIGSDLTASFFTPTQVAASLNADSVPAGTFASELNGRIRLYGETSVEIGFGTTEEKDLTGCAALGFAPGWRVVNGVSNWLPDSGVSLGLTRSPVNLDRSQSDPDFKADVRVEDMLLVKSVQEAPYVFLDNPPLQDVAGVDFNVFFNLTTTVLENLTLRVINTPLRHYEDIIHRFGNDRFDWVEEGATVAPIEQPTSTLTLGTPNLVLDSMRAAPGIGGGLWITGDTGVMGFQDPDTDYVLPLDGLPGSVTLIERFGNRVTYGGLGTCEAGGIVFTDTAADFLSELAPVEEGYRLKISSGENAGSYKIEDVSTTSLMVTPPFLASTDRPVAWEVFRGYTDDVYDPALVADITYKSFDHLPEEPFKIRLLHPVGTVGDMTNAQVEGAVSSGRIVTLRFGLVAPTSSTEATLTPLGTEGLGPMANGSLDLPDVTSARFTGQAFAIQIGTTEYSGSNVVGVTEFSADPACIEYMTAAGVENDVAVPKGRLKFSTTLISQYGTAPVTYRETFMAPASLTAGEAEFNPVSGALNISAADAVTHAGKNLYFVEQLITEDEKDVAINPQSGAFAPNVPVPKGAVVEVEYWKADLEGRKIGSLETEFLSVFIQREAATREKENVYRFNSAGMTIDERVDPTVWIGAMMQNFGQVDCIVDYPDGATGEGRITFVSKTVDANDPVAVTYAVFEAQGGERTFEASQKPLYRPPFFIKEAQYQFGLRGDRVDEFLPGQMLRIGEDCFYIKSLKYFPETDTGGDVTAVRIFPHTVGEVGSRSPGNDVLRLISTIPVTTVVDPDGETPVATTAPAGFMSTIDCTVFPFEPVSRGQKTIVFKGDLTQFAVPGHLLEIAGCPHAISDTKMSEDGSYTLITVTGGFVRGYDVLEAPTIKLSYRPVYPPETRDFLGCGPMLESENVELVLFGETNAAGQVKPGRTLVPGVEYFADPTSGTINLLSPSQDALGAGQTLTLSFTRLRTVGPVMKDQALTMPSYNATYLYNTLPSVSNGFLNGQVTATYTFHNPDSFYFRAVSLQQFLGEATREAVAEITSKVPAGGAVGGQPASENWEMGRFGILGERKHLLDKDRAARAFLSFYNDSIVMFEQVKEAISGGIVGDRDGKFRFWVGHDREYPTPGYEDEISGLLTPRNVWADVFQSHRYKTLYVDSSDYLTTPMSAGLTNAEVSGTSPDSDYLNSLLAEQGSMVQNDIDDIVMFRMGKTTYTFIPTFPFFRFRAKGVFAEMGSEHRFSRLYPTLSKALFRLLPGVGAEIDAGDGFDPGVYTAGREIGGKDAKTRKNQIGQLSNPVLGEIDGVKSAALQVRRARGRIWGYFPNGIPAGAFLDGASAAISGPCVIAFPTLLGEVPINPNTGFPDETKLMSHSGQLGWVPDSTAGDPELAIPGFEAGDQVAWGKPDGTSYKVVTGSPITLFGTSLLASAFVYGEVLYGCVIRFRDFLGNHVENPDLLMVATETAGGIPAHEFPIERGDTLYAVPATGFRPSSMEDEPELTDSPTFETYSQMAAGLDTYRENFDLDVKKDGRIVDKTLWSWDDPNFFGLKELFGQHPPQPMSALEGPVEFTYGLQNPLLIPALEGKYQDDSGDYTIPYLKTGVTEMDRFDQISTGLSEIMSSESAGGESVYPDEFLGADGSVVGSGVNPAALLTDVDVLPGASLGVGDARPFDFMFIQAPATGQDASFSTGAGLTKGPHGIWSVASVATSAGGSSIVEPPRFITHSRAPQAGSTDTGDAIRYTLDNAIVHLFGAEYPPTPQGEDVSGVQIYERAAGTTVLDLTSTTIALNDGETIGTGNFNDIDTDGASITIRLIAYPDNLIEFGPDGANPLPSATGGVEALRIRITGGTLEVWTYQDDPEGAPSYSGALGAAVQWGVKEAADPAPGSVLGYRKVIIPLTGFIPWVPGVLPPGWDDSKWFLPYEMNGADYEMLYPFEVAIDIDAHDGKLSNRAWVDEDRLTFHEICDLRHAQARDTTHPLTDLSLETQLVVYGTQLGLTGGTEVWSEANKFANGLDGANPVPFTIVARDSVVGTWEVRDGDTTERGSLKVMGFEGWDNTPLTAEDVTFSVIPGSDYATGEATPILLGTGLMGSRFNIEMGVPDRDSIESRVKEVGVVVGDVADVQPGDVAVVTGSANSDHPGSLHVGTYLVRHAIAANEEPLVGEFRQVNPLSPIDSTTDWCRVSFPEVVSYDSGESKLTISHLAPTGSLSSGFAPPGADTRIYVLVDYPKLASGTELTFRRAVISALYTAVETGPDGEGIFTVTDWKDAKGESPAEGDPNYTDFESLLEAGQQVSGMVYLPVVMGGSNYGLPENNTVGWDSVEAGKEAAYGWRRLTLNPPLELRNFSADADKAQPIRFNVAGALGDADGGIDKVGAAGDIVPVVTTPGTSKEFYSDPITSVYHWVTDLLMVSLLTDAQWDKLNIPTGSAGAGAGLVNCVLPGSEFRCTSYNDAAEPVLEPGFLAQAGVFFEPSVPRAVADRAQDFVHVVDRDHSVPDPVAEDDWDRVIGSREANAYNPAAVVSAPEMVQFEIRRIRRFHDVAEVEQNLKPLRYAYEIRRGMITSYTQDDKQTGFVTAESFTMNWETVKPAGAPKANDAWNDGLTHTGTNLGPFTDPDVNIHPGDMFRLLDEDGVAVEEARVVSVLGNNQLKLAAPGLTQYDADTTYRFEIWLRQAPVPHEQSNEKLLDLISDSEVTRTDAAWGEASETGGYALQVSGELTYEDCVNKLYDDQKAPGTGGQTFAALGVRAGDIVVIDPVGTIPQKGGLPVVQETGVRPLGDEGVAGRVDWDGNPVFTAGAPNPLDDNRGYYRVVSVVDTEVPPYLVVDPVSEFSGTAAAPVTFDSTDSSREYAVYPTVNGSTLSENNKEGQMDLRPTRARNAVTGSFKTYDEGLSNHSIRPFSYRVLRPSALFVDESIDLVLSTRERMQSLIELTRRISRGKGGSYFIFQRDVHIGELGDPTDAELGLGVMSNDFLTMVKGRVDVMPYANNSGCLSVLDRRFWTLDLRLDSLTYDATTHGMKKSSPGDPTYTAYTDDVGGLVRPVLPDLIDGVLDYDERFRAVRYVWLSYRVHTVLGTLAAIRRFDAELPDRLAEQEQLLLQLKSTEDV